MEFIVCNKCGCPPGKNQFYITSCSHVYCELCRSNPAPDFCHLCKIPTKSLKMDGSLPKSVRKIFTDISTMNSEIHKRLTKIIGFQKLQKSIQLKIESKKSLIRKEQIVKIDQKAQEFASQITKLASFEESNKKKLEETLQENEKLKDLIKTHQLERESTPPRIDNDYDDFFLKNTPTCSSPSVAGSVTDNEEMLEFDLLGLKNRSDSSSSNCSSQSNRPGSLF